MNILPMLLGFLAFQMVNKNNNKPAGKNGLDLNSLLSNPEALGVLTSLSKLGLKNADTTQALMEIVSNPMVMNLFTSLLSKNTSAQSTADVRDAPEQNNGLNVNKESKFSEDAVGFFKPVETVAGVQISEKLYHMYDNWYIKK